jgi:hypothetical protein
MTATGFDSHIDLATQRSIEDPAYKIIAKRLRAERRVATKLVNAALKAGYAVSVNDGEEWVVTKSTDRIDILLALGSTDEDVLVLRHTTKSTGWVGCTANPGDRIGWFHLVYGNADDGSELISDHSDNTACTTLYDHVYPKG